MKDENKCESPMGGHWCECEKTDKHGRFIGMGVGKAVADVTYYNKSQGKDNDFIYQMCKDCVSLYRLIAEMSDDPEEDNVVTRIEFYDKKKKIELYNQEIILID